MVSAGRHREPFLPHGRKSHGFLATDGAASTKSKFSPDLLYVFRRSKRTQPVRRKRTQKDFSGRFRGGAQALVYFLGGGGGGGPKKVTPQPPPAAIPPPGGTSEFLGGPEDFPAGGVIAA